ncbi:MAG: hypothetical protein JRJ27_17665 [Deltaproteobacteria bacterium]|nr:hypothetical protein [Deltaproteobacteria bacterium]
MIKSKFIAVLLFAIFVSVYSLSSPANAKPEGRLYVIGMGPSGADLAVPRGLAILEKADIFLCPPYIQKNFAQYIDPGKVAFDPWEGIHGKEACQLRKTDYGKWLQRVEKRKKKLFNFVMDAIHKKKTVVMLDSGDPCVYGPSLYWLLKDFDHRYLEVIPGISAFNAASAALKRAMIGEGINFVMLTAPHSMFGRSFEKGDGLLKDLSKYNVTMVFYMAISSMDKLVEKFSKYYPSDLPMAIVYYAGYSDKQMVLKTSLGTVLDDLKKCDEKWLGLLIIGNAVK